MGSPAPHYRKGTHIDQHKQPACKLYDPMDTFSLSITANTPIVLLQLHLHTFLCARPCVFVDQDGLEGTSDTLSAPPQIAQLQTLGSLNVG